MSAIILNLEPILHLTREQLVEIIALPTVLSGEMVLPEFILPVD